MSVPALKRVTISSLRQLDDWFRRQPEHEASVMLVTHNQRSSAKHVSTADVQRAIGEYGWQAGFRYNLNPHLTGHVIHRTA